MKKSKMCCQFTFALLALFISSPSLAAPYGNYGQMITCTTFSNGLEFSDESRDPSVARSSVAEQCRSNRRTNNSECDANIACNDGSYNPPMFTCTTSSNGLEFFNESRDPWVARTSVAEQCRDNKRTSNAECDANVICNDDGPSYPRTPQEPPRREPIPVPRREICVANRFDPAGRFVQGYRGQECSEAMKMCNVEIRGRQYCEIAH